MSSSVGLSEPAVLQEPLRPGVPRVPADTSSQSELNQFLIYHISLSPLAQSRLMNGGCSEFIRVIRRVGPRHNKDFSISRAAVKVSVQKVQFSSCEGKRHFNND